MGWRNTAAALKLRDQIDARWPNRDTRSDGTIGDPAHAARESDHNPDRRGWVHAIDIDADLDPRDQYAAERLASQLIAYARSGVVGSERLKYVVFRNRIASGTYADSFWTWRSGAYGHEHHIHVSFTEDAERDGSPFPLPVFLPDLAPVVPLPTPTPTTRKAPEMFATPYGASAYRLVTDSAVIGISATAYAALKAAGYAVPIPVADVQAITAALGTTD